MTAASQWLWNPWFWMIAGGVLFLGWERLRPISPVSRVRWRAWTDLAHLFFFQYSTLLIAWIGSRYLEPPLWGALARAGYPTLRYDIQLLVNVPLAWQIAIIIVANDLLGWIVHRMLHEVPLLWTFHKVHHSVQTDEMWFLSGSRFHLVETIVYRVALYIPLVALAVYWQALAVKASVDVLSGFFTHANLDVGRGRISYAINTPAFHWWHHAYTLPGGRTVNYGFRSTIWDWLFGTAYLPASPPDRLGYEGDGEMYNNFVGHQAFPLARRSSATRPTAPTT